MLSRRIILLLVINCFSFHLFAQEVKGAFSVFGITPEVGTSSGILSRAGNNIQKVYGDIKTTVFLFEENGQRYCLLTSGFWVDHQDLRPACIEILSKNLQVSLENIVTSSAHNHTVAWPLVDEVHKNSANKAISLSYDLGQKFVKALDNATKNLNNKLQPITISWGKVEENRIAYNRRSVNAQGIPYFMREEDRLSIAGEGYHGVIDPNATVVIFKDLKEKPLAALTNFTAHPLAAYNPEAMFSFGQFPQMANDKLSAHLGGIPVGFMQGCAGDINAKHMLTGTIEQAKSLGEMLGDSFIKAAQHTVKSRRLGIQWKKSEVSIPFATFPSLSSLEADLSDMNDFIKRGNAGDQNTMNCVGMNFSVNLSPAYRARLIEMVKPWYEWAITQHTTNNIYQLPTHRVLEMVVASFGDVGIVAMPFEPFVKTGLKIKQDANLPCVIAAGYANGANGYIPDASAVDDREYMAGHFRYVKNGQPYAAPGGDVFAIESVKILNQFAK